MTAPGDPAEEGEQQPLLSGDQQQQQQQQGEQDTPPQEPMVSFSPPADDARRESDASAGGSELQATMATSQRSPFQGTAPSTSLLQPPTRNSPEVFELTATSVSPLTPPAAAFRDLGPTDEASGTVSYHMSATTLPFSSAAGMNVSGHGVLGTSGSTRTTLQSGLEGSTSLQRSGCRPPPRAPPADSGAAAAPGSGRASSPSGLTLAVPLPSFRSAAHGRPRACHSPRRSSDPWAQGEPGTPGSRSAAGRFHDSAAGSPLTVRTIGTADTMVAAAQAQLIRGPARSPVFKSTGRAPRWSGLKQRAAPTSPLSSAVYTPRGDASSRWTGVRPLSVHGLNACRDSASDAYEGGDMFTRIGSGGARSVFSPQVRPDSSRSPSHRRTGSMSSVLMAGSQAAPTPWSGFAAETPRGPPRTCVAFFVAEPAPQQPDGSPSAPSLALAYPMSPAALNARHPFLPVFCYADKRLSPRRFTFTLTGADRQLLHVHSLRVQGGRCICFMSSLPWFSLFDGALDAAAAALAASPGTVPKVAAELVRAVIPAPTQSLKFGHITWRVPQTLARYPLGDVDLGTLTSAVGLEGVTVVLRELLLEGRVLFVDDDIGRLTGACHAAVALMCPMEWPHTFVPLLPEVMLEAACAPTPWVFGVHASCMSQLAHLPMESCVCVDLRSGALAGREDGPALPCAVQLQERLHHRMGDAARALDIVLSWFVALFAGLREYVEPAQDLEGKEILWLDLEELGRTRDRPVAPAQDADPFVRAVAGTSTFIYWVQSGMRGPGEVVDAFGAKARRVRPDLYLDEAERSHTPPGTGRDALERSGMSASACSSSRRRSSGGATAQAFLEALCRRRMSDAKRGATVPASSARGSAAAPSVVMRATANGSLGRLGRGLFGGKETGRVATTSCAGGRGPPPSPPRPGQELLLWAKPAGRGTLHVGTVISADRHMLSVIFEVTRKIEKVDWEQAWTQGQVASHGPPVRAEHSAGVC
eukprot:TRINITY_DN495_c0_g1_i2.p1 TRINITY_DN495_c0_g1~~TRINITY_DN495_c0_g1_i2.p1  ORF type:complete len:1008 (+),score=205.01 TRINITY_DN495_c0_g1_i2:73-3024(+)